MTLVAFYLDPPPVTIVFVYTIAQLQVPPQTHEDTQRLMKRQQSPQALTHQEGIHASRLDRATDSAFVNNHKRIARRNQPKRARELPLRSFSTNLQDL
jgi:hypothetical protein